MSFKTNDIRTAAVIPANSTTIFDLNAVMYDTSDRLATCTKTAIGAERFAGFASGGWSAQIANDRFTGVGTDAFATPASFSSGSGVARVTVLQEGHIVAIPLTETAGQRGDRVYLSTATAGSQIFTLFQQAAGQGQVWVGTLDKDFTGATANDKQQVVVRPCSVNTTQSDVGYWLNNHVEDGLLVAFDDTSKLSFAIGAGYVGGKYFRVAAAANLDMAACASHATKCRISLLMLGPTGVVAAVDTGGVKFILLSAAANNSASTAMRNSHFWPTVSFANGIVIGAALFRSGSADLAASRVMTIRRSAMDVAFRKYITGNPYQSGSPTLR